MIFKMSNKSFRRPKNHDFIKAKKSLGQNFCRDGRIPAEILDTLNASGNNHVWEIGPGHGALTKELVKTGAKVTAFEIDERLKDELLANFPEVDFIWKDFLSIRVDDLPKATKELLVCGNLPYYCGTSIIKRFLEYGPKAKTIVFLLQEEVSNKAAASFNTKIYGYLSVHTQLFSAVKTGGTYPPSSFVPRPKINSTILILEPFDLSQEEIDKRKKALKFVSALFLQRRKMALPLLRKRFPDTDWTEKFKILEIPEKARPENISPETFLKLFSD